MSNKIADPNTLVLSIAELSLLVEGLDELLRQAWDFGPDDGDAEDVADNEKFKQEAGALWTKLTGEIYPEGSS